MKRLVFVWILLAMLCACIPALAAPESQSNATSAEEEADIFEGLKPIVGPATLKLGTEGEIKVPENFVALGAKDTITLLGRMENLTNGAELGLIAPASFDWFVVFEYDNAGHVKDDEKDTLDAGAILQSYKDGVEESNKEKKSRGWATSEVVGWAVKPHFNDKTKNLEWGLNFKTGEHVSLNYNVRFLGREGVMEATVVLDPEDLSAVLPESRKVMDGYAFVAGRTYGEYRQGDKLAGYGLAALIAGGAAAAVAKSGGGKWIGKLLVAGGAAVVAFLGKLFRRKKQQ